MPISRPHDLLTWAVYGLLYGLSRLPWSWQLALGRGFGRLMYVVMRGPRRTARINLGLCFPGRGEAEYQAMLRCHFARLGGGVFELALAWWGSDEEIARQVTFEGWEHMAAVRATGRGTLLLTPHMVNMGLAARVLLTRGPFSMSYKPDKDPLTDRLVRRHRSSAVLGMINADDVRRMVRTLRDGDVLWYAPDIDFRHKGRLFANFFGVPAATPPHTARLAEAGNALVVPYALFHRPDGGYRAVVRPPLADFPSGDAQTDAERVNEAFESLVGEAPDSYLWTMRRFRTRPGDEPNPYR